MTSLFLALVAGLARETWATSPSISGVIVDSPSTDDEAARVSIDDREPSKLSPYGGAILTIVGENLLPANYDSTDANSETQIRLSRRDNDFGCPDLPCPVIPHYAASTQLICEMPRMDLDSPCLDGNWRLRATVDGVESNWSSNMNFRDFPIVKYLSYGSGSAITPGVPGGSWSQWFNEDVAAGGTSEHEGFSESVLSTLRGMNCMAPLGIQVREVSTGNVIEDELLVSGWGECLCHANIYTGLYCYQDADGTNGEGQGTPCSIDHEVRYFCSDGNVVDFYETQSESTRVIFENSYFGKDIDVATSFAKIPALYDASGAKLAECQTMFDDNGVQVPINGYDKTKWWLSPHYRCQMAWSSATPRVGNYMFQFGTNRGYSRPRQQFMCADGNVYNMQVHPTITGVSPADASVNGGTKVTVTGENLQGDVEIRVGGVECENVVVNGAQTEATCTTKAALGACNAGDTAVEDTNCVTVTDRPWNIQGSYTGTGESATTIYAKECATPCVSESAGKNGRCTDVEGNVEWCIRAPCSTYARKYPGGSGLQMKFMEKQGGNVMNSFWSIYMGEPMEGSPAQYNSESFEFAYFTRDISMRTYNHNNNDNYQGVLEGFLKPLFDGYYSFFIPSCDDQCHWYVSINEPDKGCPNDLNGYAYRHGASDDNGDRVGSVSRKFYLSANHQYYMQLTMLEGTGGDYSEFGLVYHGENANKNYVHGNTGITMTSHASKGVMYMTERQRVEITNTPQIEQQKVNMTKVNAAGDFFVYVCSSDEATANNCVASDPINTAMSNEDAQVALGVVREATCSVTGRVETGNGFYWNMDSVSPLDSAVVDNVSPFCGLKTVEVSGSAGFSVKADDVFGESFKVKNTPDLCVASKGYGDNIWVKWVVDGSEIERDYLWTTTDPNRWTFGCVDMNALATELRDALAVDGTIAADFNVGQIQIKRVIFRDLQARGKLYLDELYFGDKSAQFDVVQTQAATVPGTFVTGFEVAQDGEFFMVTMHATDTACGESFTMLRAGTSFATSVEFESVTKLGAGVTGDFALSYEGMTATIQTAWLHAGNDNEIKNQIRQQFGGDFATAEVVSDGNCNEGYEMTIDIHDTGDYNTLTVDATNLVADKAMVRVLRNGGVVFKTLSAAMMSTASATPQVQVWANHVQAICSGDCSIGLNDNVSPNIASAPSSAGVTEQITLTGTNFDVSGNEVFVNGMSVAIDTESATEITITLNAAMPGDVEIMVVSTVGSSNTVTVTLTSIISSVSPSSGPAGTSIIIQGAGLASPVMVGGMDCLIHTEATTEIECTVVAAEGSQSVSVGGASDTFTVTASPSVNCTVSNDASPSGDVSVTVTCDSVSSIDAVFVNNINAAASSGSNIVTFKPQGELFGTYDLHVLTDIGLASETITYSASVTFLDKTAHSIYGGSSMKVYGENLGDDMSQISISVGGNDCPVTSTLDGGMVVCTVPAMDGTFVSLTAGGSSLRTGTFSPSTVSVPAGTKVMMDWNLFLESDSSNQAVIPTIQLSASSTDGPLFTLPTVDANTGSAFYVFTTPGEYTLTTGLYDGASAITATITVGAAQTTEVPVTVMIGNQAVDTTIAGTSAAGADGCCGAACTISDPSTGTVVYSSSLANIVTGVTVSGASVTVESAAMSSNCDISIMVADDSCTPAVDTCDVNVAGGMHKVSITNGVPISSVVDVAYSFMPVISSVQPASGSKYGGVRLTLTGSNLKADTVMQGDCAPTVEMNNGVTCVLITCATDLEMRGVGFDFDANNAKSTYESSGVGIPEYIITSVSANGDITGMFTSISADNGTYSVTGMMGDTTGSCGTVDIINGMGSFTCSFAKNCAGEVTAMFGIIGGGFGAPIPAAVTPVLNSVSPTEGSLFGGAMLTISGSGFSENSVVSITVDGNEICGACVIDTTDVESGSLYLSMPTSGSDAGPLTAMIVVSNGDAQSASASFDLLGALTPKPSSLVATGNSLRINMDKGVNADCSRNQVTVNGIDAPVTSCSATRRRANGQKTTMFIEAEMPSIPAGDYPVLVTNMDTGNSDGSHSVSVGFSADSVSPASSGIAGGAPMTITGVGMNFMTASVTICGNTCVIDTGSSSSYSLKCTIPASSLGATETCDVVITDGVNSQNFASAFSYDDSLTASVDSITASGKLRGGTAGGTRITITGSGFNDADGQNVVTIGGSECAIESFSATELICRTGVAPATGYYDVNVNVVGVGVFSNSNFQFRYINAWSSPATWGCSTGTFADCATAPTDTRDLVEIPSGVEILLDVSTAYLSVLLIRGSLIWDTDVADIELSAEYILIIDGKFELGTEDAPMMLPAKITMYGHHRSIRLPIYGAKVFAARSGTVDIHGAPISPTWTDLDETAEAGATTLKLQSPSGLSGWQVGDRIAIAPTGDKNSIVEAETRIITAINDLGDGTTTLTIDEPLDYMHLGVESGPWERPDGTTFMLQQRAAIGLLSRNVKFQGSVNPSPWYDEIPQCEGGDLDLGLGAQQNCFVNRFDDEEGSDKMGAHMLLHSVTHGKVEFMEVHHAGQAFDLGRYPVHFHNSYAQPDSYFRGLGIWRTYNRAMTMHAVNNATFEWNVAYNNMGHAFFTEDAVETYNRIQYNLAIKTKPSSSMLSVDQTPTSFWIVNTANYIIGNRAAGAAGFGFWVNPPKRSTGSNVNNDYCPRNIPVLEFRDNVAHSCGVYGMWIFEEYNPRKDNWDGSCDKNQDMAGASHPMESFTTWHNHRGVEFSFGSGLHMDSFVSADNFKAELSVKENTRDDNFEVDSLAYNNAVVIGASQSHATNMECTSFGMETPWKFGSLQVSGISFYNFAESTKSSESCYAIDYCYSSYPFDCGRISRWSNVKWFNTDRRGHFDWEFETVLWDIDGTLSGTNLPNTKITPKSELYTRHCSDIQDGWDLGFPAQVCDENAIFHRASFESASSDFGGVSQDLNGVTMNVNNENDDTPNTVTAQVPWREKRGDSGRAWMFMPMQNYINEIWLEGHYNHPNFTFALKTNYDMPGHFSTFKMDLKNQPDEVDSGENGFNNELSAIPNTADPTMNYGWFIDESSGGDVYFTLQSNGVTEFGPVERKNFHLRKCWYPNCIIPDPNSPSPPAEIVTCMWSDASCWPSGSVPGLDSDNRENVTIVIDRHVVLDVANVYVDNLYIGGTLEVDHTLQNDFRIEVTNILINSPDGGIDTFETAQFVFQSQDSGARKFRNSNEDNLPEWQFGRLLVGTEESPVPCGQTVTIAFSGAAGPQERPGWGAPSASVPAGNKTIASYGRVSMVGCGPENNYLRLKQTAQPGDTKLFFADGAVAGWKIGDQVVLSGTGISDRETEYFTITAISQINHRITLDSAVQFIHLGSDDTVESDSTFAQAAEVGLLSKNIKIDGSAGNDGEKYGGRMLIAGSSFGSNVYRQGHAHMKHVEFYGMGQYGSSMLWDPRYSLAFYGVDATGKARDESTDANGNAFQPVGYEVGTSYVKHCTFHMNYGVALGVAESNNMEVSNNNVAHAVDNGINIGYSLDVTVNNNMVADVQDNWFYKDTYLNFHNFDADLLFVPAGIALFEEVTYTSFMNNAASGVQGPAFEFGGETCDESESQSDASSSSISSGNYAHSSLYGVRLLYTSISTVCTKFSGFNIARIYGIGIMTMLETKHVIIDNVDIQDTNKGIAHVAYKPLAISHQTADKTVTVKNTVINAATNAANAANLDNCRDWSANTGLLQFLNPLGGGQFHIENGWFKRMTYDELEGHQGVVWTLFQGQKHKFPHKPIDVPTGNMVLYGTNYFNNVKFVNFEKSAPCGKAHVAVANWYKQHDHHHQIISKNVQWAGRAAQQDANAKLFLYEPNIAWINPSECVDMDCDGPKKAMMVDTDGSFSGTNKRTTFMGVAELEFGVNGPRGLGYFRIPAVMLVNMDGSNKNPEQVAPKHGVYRNTDCSKNLDNHYWECSDKTEYMQVLYESMDIDTETRRTAPIAYINNPGEADSHVDIVNGVLDTSCCAGYSCQLRQTTHPLIMACGKTYEMATAGTINKNFNLHTNRENTNCKNLLKIYTGRQNRQDVSVDGNLMLATNSFFEADGSIGFSLSDPSHIPDISAAVGTNYFDRREQLLYVVVGGSTVTNINVAKSLIVEFQSNAIELTADELYDSELLINYLAALLGIPQSQIKIVDVVPEGGRRRRDASWHTYGRGRRSNGKSDIIVEILAEDPTIPESDETSYETSTGESKTDIIKTFAETIVSAIINEAVPEEVAVDPIVTTAVVVKPSLPECYSDTLEQYEDPLFVPGDGCSLAAQLGVEPQDLDTVIDTEVLPTYDENQQDEIEALEAAEEETTYKPPVEWLKKMWPSEGPKRNEIISPPPRFELLDAAGDICNTAAYTATVSIESASNSNQQFGEGSQTTVNFNSDNQAIFENLHFDFPGDVVLRFTLSAPADSGLPDYIGESIEIRGRGEECQNATCAEEACEFAEDRIVCVDKNLGSSTTGILSALQGMTQEALGKITWLVVNQNQGLNADDLVGIMSLLINLERLSLNSDDLWYLHPDTFNVQTKLRSISLHNNAINCLDGVFDHLIDHDILQRVRLTENELLMSENGWNAEYRYRGDAEMEQLKTLINSNLCTSR